MKRFGKLLRYAVGIYGAVLALWALQDLYRYWRLDAMTTGRVVDANVHERSSSSFEIIAVYDFTFDGKSYRASSSLGKPYQLNSFSAQKVAEELKGSAPAIYFKKKDPEISSLIKAFPYKSMLQAGLILGICLYLWILELQLGKRRVFSKSAYKNAR